ncbi:MAG: thioredoxin [Thermoplasmatota archaeon]
MEWPDGVVELNEEQLDDFVNRYPVVVVDFWGPACAPCKMIAPIIQELSRNMKGKAAFAKMDVTQNLKLASRMSIRSIPTIVFYKNGQVVKQKVGFLAKNKFLTEINEIL